MTTTAEAVYLTPEDLRVGLHVHLDLSWMEHPFPSANFKIKNDDQIATIRSLKLKRIRYSPELSDGAVPGPVAPTASETVAAGTAAEPAAPAAPAAPVASNAATAAAAAAAQPAAQARAARQAERRAARKTCERELLEAARAFKSLSRNVYALPDESRETAQGMVHNLAGTLLSDTDVTLHLMADQVGGELVYQHALNVALLAMMLARALKAPAGAIELIGLGALFHDIGKIDIPERLWRSSDPLTRAEQALVQQHVPGGVEIARKMALPAEVQQIITQHHELVDGSGYPKKLKGTQISLLARIVAIANVYDKLCNPLNASFSLSPREALAAMYGLQRSKFDDAALTAFVRCMGIYPPGTLVGLSDGSVGMVVAVNASQPLKPVVLVYDPAVPREAALLVALEEEPDLAIDKTPKASELDPAAAAYLGARARMTYGFEAGKKA
ncbi:MAG: HD domain-containing phosphohydrolase [Burkholderiales bacterium]